MYKAIVRLTLLSVLYCYSWAAVAQEKGAATVTLEGQVVCSVCWFEADRKIKPYGDEGDGRKVAMAGDGLTTLPPWRKPRSESQWERAQMWQ